MIIHVDTVCIIAYVNHYSQLPVLPGQHTTEPYIICYVMCHMHVCYVKHDVGMQRA